MTASPKRFRFQILSFLAMLLILAAATINVAEQARWVDLVALVGSSFAAGATFAVLLARRRLSPSSTESSHG